MSVRTEIEWSLQLQAPAVDGEVYEFAVFNSGTLLATADPPSVTVGGVVAVTLVVADALHAHTADNVTITEVTATTLVVANALHAHTAQSFALVVGLNVSNCVHTILPVAGPYHEPQLGYISTPDPGPIPDAFIIVAKISNLLDVEIAHQANANGSGDFWAANPFPLTYVSFLRRQNGWFDPIFSVGSNASGGMANQTISDVIYEPGFPIVPYWAMAVTLTPTYQIWTYYSIDGTTWVQIPTGTSGYPAMPVWQTDYPVIVGATSTWNTSNPKGSFHSVEMRTGTSPTAGSVMWRMDVTEYVSGSAWTDARGRTWTLSNPASIVPDVKLVEVGASITLAVQNAVHAHAADNVTTSYVVLAPAAGVHAHTSVAPTLGVDPAVQSAAHAITSTDVVLVVDPAVQSATHLHSAENVTLQLLGDLAIQSAVHNHAADNVAPLNINMDGVQNAVHAHAAANVIITPGLLVDSALHGHTAEEVSFTGGSNLSVQGAVHSPFDTLTTITQVHNLAVDGAAHAHDATTLLLAGGSSLLVADSAHVVTSANVLLVQTHNLTVDSSSHTLTSVNVTLVQQHNLALSSAVHAHTVTGDLALTGVAFLLVQTTRHMVISSGVTLREVEATILNNAVAVYLGSVPVSRIYVGATKVWP